MLLCFELFWPTDKRCKASKNMGKTEQNLRIQQATSPTSAQRAWHANIFKNCTLSWLGIRLGLGAYVHDDFPSPLTFCSLGTLHKQLGLELMFAVRCRASKSSKKYPKTHAMVEREIRFAYNAGNPLPSKRHHSRQTSVRMAEIPADLVGMDVMTQKQPRRKSPQIPNPRRRDGCPQDNAELRRPRTAARDWEQPKWRTISCLLTRWLCLHSPSPYAAF